MHLKFGQFTTIVNGDYEFVDEEENETTQDNTSYHTEDNEEDTRGLCALALAYYFEVNLKVGIKTRNEW